MGCFFSGLTSGSSAIGQLGKSVGICGRQAISNPVVDAIGGAALAYFAPELLGAGGLGGLTGMGVAANAGLVTGGIVGLSTGNLSKGLSAGLAGWGGAGIEQSLEQYSIPSAKNAVNPSVGYTSTGQPWASNTAMSSEVTPGSAVMNPSASGATPYASTATPAPVANASAVTNATNNPSMWQKAKCFIATSYAEHPGYTVAAGLGAVALGAQALKKAAQPNTIAAATSPASNVIRQYSYNPYTEKFTPTTVTNASNFGSSSFNPGQGNANGGIVALANGGAVAFANGGSYNKPVECGFSDLTSNLQSELIDAQRNQCRAEESGCWGNQQMWITRQQGIQQQLDNLSNPKGVLEDRSSYNGCYNACRNVAPPPDTPPPTPTPPPPDTTPPPPDTTPTPPVQQVAPPPEQQVAPPAPGITALQDVNNPPVQAPPAFVPPTPVAPPEPPPAPPPEQPIQSPFTGGITTLPVTTIPNPTTPTEMQVPIGPTAPAPVVTPAPVLPPSQMPQAPDQGVGGITGPGVVGGGTVINPNGSVTQSPKIPGIPVGGFTGISSLLNAYQMGGGSLGNPINVPTTMDQFNTEYNTVSGDSKAAYDFLMGKTTQPRVTTASILQKPYAVSVGASKLGPEGASNSYQSPTPNQITVPSDAKQVQGSVYVSNGTNYLSDGTIVTPYQNGQYTDQYGYIYDASGIPIGSVPGHANGGHIKKYAGKADSLVNNASEAYELNQINDRAYKCDPNEAFLNTVPSSVMRTPTGLGLAAAMYSPNLNNNEQAKINEMNRVYANSPNSQYVNGRPRHSMTGMAMGGMTTGHLGGYSDGGRLLRGPGDGVSDSIPATIGAHNPEPARLADGEFVVPARIVSELGNGSTEAGARKLYQMMDRIQKNRAHSVGNNKVAVNSHSEKFLPA